MRKVILSNLVTLDGFVAGPNGELDWFIVDEEFNEYGGRRMISFWLGACLIEVLLFKRDISKIWI